MTGMFRRRLLLAVGLFAWMVSVGVSAQGPDMRGLMRAKLVRSQNLLRALVTSDWPELESGSRELLKLTDDPRWTPLRYPEYGRYAEAFRMAVNDLHTAAAARDQDKAPQAYAAVTLQCVACHRYLARSRVAAR